MSKKNLTITLIALIIVLIGVGAYFYWQSFKAVTYNFLREDVSVTIYRQEGEERASIDSLDKTAERRLQRGTYLIIPSGDTYSQNPITFEVKDKDITVDINPAYSDSYRRILRGIELPAIKEVLSAAYPDIINNYLINDGEIYKEGQWYGTLLVEKAQGSDEGDVYRTVLKKEAGKWAIKAAPDLVLTAKEYPDIPKEILSSINGKRPQSTTE